MTDAHGVKTRYEYDGVGNLLSIVNGRSSRTRFEYDEAGQLIKETDPLGRVTRYEYDAVGNRIRRTDARGQKTDYVYDPVGRLVEVRYHDGTRHRYSFDLAGNLIRMESPASVEEYAYDPLNRLTRLTNVTLNKTVTYTYDAVGNRTSLLDPYGRLLRYEFDELNRVMRFVDPDDRPTSYRYDPLGRVTNVTYPNGMQADFTYDRLSRLTDLAYRNPAGVLSSFGYSYDQANNVLRRMEEDGATQSYEYDRLYRLTRVTYPEEKIRQLQQAVLTPPNGGPGKPKKSGVVLYTLAEQGKGKNQPPGQGKKDDPPGKGPKTQPPGQSPGEPLPAEDIPLVFGSADYAYDETSNRTLLRQDGAATAYQYDAADQLLQAGEETFGYDENGNTVRHQTPTGMVEYCYDGENRLVEARFPDGTWVRYAYDAFGRRVYREEAYWQNKNHLKTEITHYLWDGQQVLMEFDGKGASPLAEYYAVNGQVVAKKMFGYHGRKEPGNDDLIRTRGGLLYYLYDRLGSVVALADRQGQVVTRYYYDVFGEPLAGNLGDVYNAYGFTGKSYDKKLEMYYFGARWLNPTAGRWATQDPYRGHLASPRSLVRYQYVFNNPTNLVDRWGFQGETWMGPVPPQEEYSSGWNAGIGISFVGDKGVGTARAFGYSVKTDVEVTTWPEATNLEIEVTVNASGLTPEWDVSVTVQVTTVGGPTGGSTRTVAILDMQGGQTTTSDPIFVNTPTSEGYPTRVRTSAFPIVDDPAAGGALGGIIVEDVTLRQTVSCH